MVSTSLAPALLIASRPLGDPDRQWTGDAKAGEDASLGSFGVAVAGIMAATVTEATV